MEDLSGIEGETISFSSYKKSNLHEHSGGEGKAGYKNENVKAERAVWMARTSDVLGSFTKTDIDSYLTLIRRKVQEKCVTVQDLIHTIRKNKVSPGNQVTPIEFRFTLIKCGVILPQPLVDEVFRVFDSDKSGTMDFDEFAMWIMNAEFQPAVQKKSTGEKILTPEERLRIKVQDSIREHEQVFKIMKRKVNFMELSSDAYRKKMPLTEKDVRLLFLLFDKEQTGFIESKKLIHWAIYGKVPYTGPPPPRKLAASERPDIKKAIFDVCGRSTNLLSECFTHLPRGKAIKLSRDEFGRCLLLRGLGVNKKDSDNLFCAIGGDMTKTGAGNIDKLLDALPDHKLLLASNGAAPTHKSPERPLVPVARVDRVLREGVRLNFSDIKAALEKADNGRGMVPLQALHKIINETVMPMTYPDMRRIASQVDASEDTSLIDWKHFLFLYNPMGAPHILEGPKSLGKYVDASASRVELEPVPANAEVLARSASTPIMSAAATIAGSANVSDSAVGGPRVSKDMRRIWQAVLRECQRHDPNRTGTISRTGFIYALTNQKLGKAMGVSAVNAMADKFRTASGYVDYVSCMKVYLKDIMTKMPAQQPDAFKQREGTQPLQKLGNHPWEMEYNQEAADSGVPYWKQANKTRTKLEDPAPAVADASAAAANATAKAIEGTQKLLSKYPEEVKLMCRQCAMIFKPSWRQLRGDLKTNQDGKGVIKLNKFKNLLSNNGLTLEPAGLALIAQAFRSRNDTVKYDEFLKVCLATSV
jgi:Ca2+-binding EF-hand superfamily protein